MAIARKQGFVFQKLPPRPSATRICCFPTDEYILQSVPRSGLPDIDFCASTNSSAIVRKTQRPNSGFPPAAPTHAAPRLTTS